MHKMRPSHSKEKWGIEPLSSDPKARILPIDQRGTLVFKTEYSDIYISKPGHVIMT